MVVPLWVVGSGTCMFKQKMRSQDLDGIVDKMHALIANQHEWVAKSH
jgi:hypothetical protein